MAIQLAKRLARPMRRAQAGAIAIMAAIVLPLLLGFGALVVDMGRLYVHRTEIQNAMDACALAASSQLTGLNAPTIFDAARLQGKALMDASRVGAAARTQVSVNMLHFQQDAFNLNNVVVEFSTAASGQPWIEATTASYSGITPQTAKFVKCSYQDTSATFYLKPFLEAFIGGGGGATVVAGEAVASLSPAQSGCIFPAAMCVGSTTKGSDPAAPYGITIGNRMTAVENPNSGYGTGNFGWLDFTPNAPTPSCPGNGAAELRCLMQGYGSCSVTVGTQVGQPGQVSSLQREWNSRFGIYTNNLSASQAAPDYTGYSYPTGNNNFALYKVRRAAHDAFQGSAGNNDVLNSSQLRTLGVSRRVITTALVNCSLWNSNGNATPTVLDFGCALMLSPVKNGGSWTADTAKMETEFLGLASTPGSPCVTSGLSGGTYGPLVPTLLR